MKKSELLSEVNAFGYSLTQMRHRGVKCFTQEKSESQWYVKIDLQKHFY